MYICTNRCAMNELLEQSDRLVRETPDGFNRYLFNKINWNNRLIGVKGARGTGKTTLVLQWLKKQNKPAVKAAYFSVDDIYFTSHTILETGRDFYLQGGKLMILDEVHKYPKWSLEIKNLYDRYKDLKIVFTGSSIIEISKQEGDLSRRAVVYELYGLSFREYLAMKNILNVSSIELTDLFSMPESLISIFPKAFRPFEYFTDYLKFGYYPFSHEDLQGYFQRLRQLIRLIVEYDMSEIKGFDIRNAKKMLQLLYIISQQVPFKPNINKLAEKSKIHRNSISNYLYFLQEARLINLLYPAGVSIAGLQKPEKIYMNNTNFLYALGNPETGNVRETFFYNQLEVNYQLNYSNNSDFLVNDQYIFEVGGRSKGSKQIEQLENAYVIKDNIEFPAGKTLPLWLFGFLY